jgi:hypothetical protein
MVIKWYSCDDFSRYVLFISVSIYLFRKKIMFNVSDHLQELRSTLVGLVLILAATIIGFVWISIGIYFWLSSMLGNVWAPLVLGLIYFVPIIVFAFSKAFARPNTNPAQPPREQDLSLQAFSKTFENLSNRSPLVIIASVAVAGFLATRFPSLLSLFNQLLAAYSEEVKTRSEWVATGSPNPNTSRNDE